MSWLDGLVSNVDYYVPENHIAGSLMILWKNPGQDRSGALNAYMISRGVPVPQVCWKCRLQLREMLSTPVHFPSRLQHLQGARMQHNAAGPKNEVSSSRLVQNSDIPRTDDYEHLSRGPKITKHIQDSRGVWRPLRKTAVSEHPLGRLHGFRGHRLREKSEELKINSLGAPSEVIVLREAGFHSVPLPQIEDLQVEDKVDILSQLDAERGLITQNDVEKNIDGLRPNSHIVSWDELEKLQHQIVSGFTVSQLVKYSDTYNRRQKQEQEQLEAKTQESSTRTIKRKTEWVPGISKTCDEFDDSLIRGYDSAAFTDKQRLVLLILRQCWRLEALEVIESVGELELEIRSQELELLIEGQNPPLKAITEKFISSQEEKIEAFRSRGVVRITATKDKSERIVQEIQDKLECVRTLIVDLKAISYGAKGLKDAAENSSDAAYSQTVIDELARVTETNIKRLPDSQISISCIHTKSETHLSNRADIARRLLLTSSEIADQTKTIQTCRSSLEPILAVKYHMQSGMSWRERLRNWVRWTSATSKPVDRDTITLLKGMVNGFEKGLQHEESLGTSSSENSLPMHSSQKKTASTGVEQSAVKPSSNKYWGRRRHTDTAAIIGHVLHEVHPIPEVVAKAAIDITTQHSIFHPKAANVSRLFEMMPGMNKVPSTSLILRFHPSPWTAAGPLQLMSLPMVEMRFTVNPETKEIMRLKEVLAVVESTASDVMIPDRIHDLRFQQRTTAQLLRVYRNPLPQIQEFVNASQLNLMLGRLETPPSLMLPIPSRLCKSPIPDALENSVDGSIDAEYIFGGLEYRSQLALDFKGWQLLYTSIEGGKADGRRGELMLRPWRLNEHIPDNKSSTAWTKKFIEAAHHVVDILEFGDASKKGSLMSVESVKSASELPEAFASEKKSDFQYFRERIDFLMKHAVVADEMDEDNEESASLGLEGVIEDDEEISKE